jgi:hypothetical protein
LHLTPVSQQRVGENPKVAEKIDKLTVFGGLDGVLKQLVTLRMPA